MAGTSVRLPSVGALKHFTTSILAGAAILAQGLPAMAAPTKKPTPAAHAPANKSSANKAAAGKKTTAKATTKAVSHKTVARKAAGKQTASPSRGASSRKSSARKVTDRATRLTRAHAPAVLRKASEPLRFRGDQLLLESDALMVMDQSTGALLLEKNAEQARPIASITKLMTAMVVLDAGLPLDEVLEVIDADVDRVKYSSSRLAVGTALERKKMLHLALMSSENRAAHSLGRTFPGGMAAFVAAMNRKARELGMTSAHFFDPTGLDARNVASARDLARMVAAASNYPLIRQFSTDDQSQIRVARQAQTFRNTNPLVRNERWDISVSKTGYIREAGRCLVMQVAINGRDTLIVLMNGQRPQSRIVDSQTVRQWLEKADQRTTLRAADAMRPDIG